MEPSTNSWDERYRRPGFWAGAEPAAFLAEILPLLPKGAALDLACGEGRNAVYLAAQGWHVTAVDRSRPGLEKAGELARERGIAVKWDVRISPDGTAVQIPGGEGKHFPASVLLIEADLETAVLPEAKFDLVVCFNYLQRTLFPALSRALRPGGMLVYETYTLDQLRMPDTAKGAARGPRNPEFLLRPDELREAFPALDVLFYREFTAGRALASILARRP